MSSDERLRELEQTNKILIELARNTSERADTHQSWIDELARAQVNSEAKIAALADAQIRTEDALAQLSASQSRIDMVMTILAEKMSELAEAQAKLAESQIHTDRRLDALIDIVKEGRNGRSE
ncbi:MAG TPA: hypothetical protein VF666_02520 [Pyrinomonadaceae bacterium]|jgi:chlorite dismutase